MTHKDFMALVLHATEGTLDLLETTLHNEQAPDLDRHSQHDPATATLLLAADQLAFALVRYRAEHQIPQR